VRAQVLPRIFVPETRWRLVFLWRELESILISTLYGRDGTFDQIASTYALCDPQRTDDQAVIGSEVRMRLINWVGKAHAGRTA